MITVPDVHLVEWDRIDVRLSGARLNEHAQAYRVDPIEQLQLHFENGLLRIEGKIRKWLTVSFRVDVVEIVATRTTVRVPVHSASAFGAIPVPRFLFGLIRDRLPRELVTYEEPATFVLSLDRFLPSFVSVEIESIWIIDGGLAVTLGRGGADPPPPGGLP